MAKLIQKKEACRALEAVRKNLKILAEIKRINEAEKSDENTLVSVKCGDKRLCLNLPVRYSKQFFENIKNIGGNISKDTKAIADKYGVEFTESEKELL